MAEPTLAYPAIAVSGTEPGRSAPRSRKLRELLEHLSPALGQHGAELVAAYFDKPRYWPSLNLDAPVSDLDWSALALAAEKRARGAPMQYAVGKANFRKLTLAVDERVLIPRPETELLVDLVLARAPREGIAVDVGTGSGAIAIALATEGAFERIIATDVSRDALELAAANATSCDADVRFVEGDLLAAFQLPGLMPRITTASMSPAPTHLGAETRFSVVVSNPPYIALEEARQLPPSVRDWEPPVALYSRRGGLEHTARLVEQAASMLQDQGLLALEVDARRASLVAEMAATDHRYAQVTVEQDLTGRERFVLAVRRTRS